MTKAAFRVKRATEAAVLDAAVQFTRDVRRIADAFEVDGMSYEGWASLRDATRSFEQALKDNPGVLALRFVAGSGRRKGPPPGGQG